jgi:hypothetical protein
VDSSGQVGEYTSIALDSDNNRHISYYDTTNDDLKYARLSPPSVTTNDATAITANSATLNGNVTSAGTATSWDASFVWGTTPGVYPNETTRQTRCTTGAFNASISGLTAGATIYCRAKTDEGLGDVSYGAPKSFVVAGNSASVASATGSGTVTFATSNGNIQGLTAVAQSALACSGNPGADFPYGFFAFNIVNVAPGSAAIITITLPSPIPIGAQYWKCINGNWVNATSFLGDDDGDNVLTLTLTDGGPLDADGAVNGTIVDPGGPGLGGGGAAADGPAEGASTGESYSTTIRMANLRVAMLNVNPTQAKANQPITIAANVVNDGTETGSTQVALKINGKIEQTKLVTVGGGSSRPVKFTVTKAEPGTYTVIMGSQRASFVVAEGEAKAATPEMSDGTIAMLLLGLVVVAFVIIVALAFRRRPSY